MTTAFKTLAGSGVMAVALVASAALAQQAVVVQPPQQQQVQVRQAAPPVTRSYRSYSVRPSSELRGSVRYSPRHSSEATWRHGDSKAMGNYHSGR
jgi:hypothetical protein